MTGTQPALLAPVRPPARPGIDLRCASCADVDWPEADLVIADPPWSYVQRIGESRAENHYRVVPTSQIVAWLERLAARAPRMALWLTWPLLGEWERATREWDWGSPVTGGAWCKSGEGDEGHYGQGYHWAGCSELVLVYASGAYVERAEPIRNAWVEPPGVHSRKPVEWQRQMVRRWCPPGGLVLDPFAGLGSVAEAVLLAGEGRRYLGTEIDPERHAAALALLAQVRA
jgi:hypothetical protein